MRTTNLPRPRPRGRWRCKGTAPGRLLGIPFLLFALGACTSLGGTPNCELGGEACGPVAGYSIIIDRGGGSRGDPENPVVGATLRVVLNACRVEGAVVQLHDVGETLAGTRRIAEFDCVRLREEGDLRTRRVLDSLEVAWLDSLRAQPDMSGRSFSPLAQSLVKIAHQVRDRMSTEERWVFLMLTDGLQYGPFEGPSALPFDFECQAPVASEFRDAIRQRFPRFTLARTTTYVMPHEIGATPPGQRCAVDVNKDLAVRDAWFSLAGFGGTVVVRSEAPPMADLAGRGG